MFCANCGAELADGSKFCGECGAALLDTFVDGTEDIPQKNENDKFVCPHCGFEHIQRYELIYNQGVSSSDSTTFGIGYADSLGVGGAKTTTVTKSNLAKQVAAPQKKGYFWRFIAVLIMGGFIASIADACVKGLGTYAFYASLIGGIFLLYKLVYQWNRDVWPVAMDHWRRSYVCMRCGEHFEL